MSRLALVGQGTSHGLLSSCMVIAGGEAGCTSPCVWREGGGSAPHVFPHVFLHVFPIETRRTCDSQRRFCPSRGGASVWSGCCVAAGLASAGRGGAAEDHAARPEPEFQEACELVPQALVPARDVRPAHMVNPDTVDLPAVIVPPESGAEEARTPVRTWQDSLLHTPYPLLDLDRCQSRQAPQYQHVHQAMSLFLFV